MYVSQLDRPWLETPFLFQGFFVDSDEVLARLREYCECVFVDDERSEEVASIPSRSPSALRNADAPKPKQAPSKVLALTAATDDDSAMLKTEILTARRAHDTANRVAKLLYENIRAGEAIEFRPGIEEPRSDARQHHAQRRRIGLAHAHAENG
jgi:hypothetical protein